MQKNSFAPQLDGVSSNASKKLKPLQNIELDILKEFIRVCEKYNLRYFLLGGSALGAVRHSGFIPWDDDIDVGMPRVDYEKFLTVAKAELDKDLYLQTYKADPNYPLSFAKIRNSNTTFIQSNFSHIDMHHGVFIDVFPLDGYSSNRIYQTCSYGLFKLLRAAILYKFGIKPKHTYLHLVAFIFSGILSLRTLRNVLEGLARKIDYEHSRFVINWNGAWGLKEAMPKSFFRSGKPGKFEDLSVVIPEDHDSYLKALYGDYMTPPPPEKRLSHHLTDLIDLNESYAKFRREII